MSTISGIFLLIALYSIGNASTTTTGRQLMVGYWGQNSTGPSVGDPSKYEKPLKEVCQTTKYDILNLAFLNIFWDSRNEDSLPALNFAHHCDQSISDKTPSLLHCPNIEEGIKECQNLGKKVLLSIGGPTGDGTLPSPSKAKEFAWTLHNLFLGGDNPGYKNLRPFGSAVLDGIDLDIEGGRGEHYPYLIRELRMLMDQKGDKRYLITAAPQCPYPDHFLEQEKTGLALTEAAKHVDYLFVQFYNNYCHTGDLKSFSDALEEWLSFSNSGPLIFLGLPAHPSASSNPVYYRSPSELKVIYEKLESKRGLGGIMLWDVSWDQNNKVDGKQYSEHVFDLLKDTQIMRTTTEAPAQGGTTAQAPTTAPFTCEDKSDGDYPNPADCTKYYRCMGGVKYELSCPSGLLFDSQRRICDWPEYVQCA